jgi:copper transport protein
VSVGVLVGAAPAAAHTTLVSTDPADGEVVAETPDVVTFTFDEPVSLTDRGIGVVDARGAPVPAAATSAGAVVTADLPDELADGTYVVTYRVVSTDGHPVAGSLTFSIGAPSATVPPPDLSAGSATSVRTALAAVQALGYVGLLLAAGLVVFQCWLLGGARLATTTSDLLTRVHWGATGLAILAAAATVPLAGADRQGLGLRGALESDAVDLDLVRDDLGVLAMVTVGLVAGLFARRRRVLATLGAAVAVAAPAAVGHTRAFDPVPLLVASDVLHVAAGAIWLGGLVGLALTLPALAGRAGDAAEVLTRFSGVAAGGLVLLVVTGTLAGWRILGSWSGLVETTYGRLLLVKVAVVGLVVGVAAWNRFRLLPRVRAATDAGARHRASGVVRRAVGAEALLLVAVLGITGFLTHQFPRGSQPDDPAASVEPDVGWPGGPQIRPVRQVG